MAFLSFVQELSPKEIGGISALYYVGSDDTTVLIWDNGEYIFHIMSNSFAKDEVTKLALSLKEVEK